MKFNQFLFELAVPRFSFQAFSLGQADLKVTKAAATQYLSLIAKKLIQNLLPHEDLAEVSIWLAQSSKIRVATYLNQLLK